MTKKKKSAENYDAFMKDMKEVTDVEKILEQMQDLRAEVSDKAREDIRGYAHKVIKRTEKVPAPIKAKSKKDLNDAEINTYATIGLKTSKESYANNFHLNLESIVDDEMSDEQLEKIVKYEPVVEKASAGQRVVIGAYNQWQGLVDLAKRYEKGETVGEKEVMTVKAAAAHGAGEAMAESLKKKGYSARLQEETKALMAELIAKGDYDLDALKNYAKIGFKTMISEAEKGYQTAAKGNNLADISRDIIKKMAKGDGKEFETITKVVYEAGKKDK